MIETNALQALIFEAPRTAPARGRRGVLAAALALALAPMSAVHAQTACDADIGGDGVVGASDLAALLSSWGPCVDCPADLDGNGDVNAQDLATILTFWDATCSPLPWATVLQAAPDPAVVTSASLRAQISATGLPWRVRDNGTQIEMLLVPPGTFDMGCSASEDWECSSDENPVHSVTLTNAFYMGRHEVTQDQWSSEMGANPSFFTNPSAQVAAGQIPNRPVERVTWSMAQDFATSTGLRLPTEAEWEYAYRAGTTTAFHSMPGFANGTNDDQEVVAIAWFAPNAQAQTRPVGQRAANALGLHDMSGNVWEWVNDRYGGYSAAAQTNPTGPKKGLVRVIRGGSIYSSGSVRASRRGSGAADYTSIDYGFRVARNP